MRAVEVLPINGFVWLDDFRPWFSKTRPLRVPDDSEVARWEAEQVRTLDPDEVTGVLNDGMPLAQEDAELHLDVIVPPSLAGRLWRISKPDSGDAENDDTLASGRPPTRQAKTDFLNAIVQAYMEVDGSINDRHKLPGKAEDLLTACMFIERAVTEKCRTFSITVRSFKDALANAGLGMASGRPRRNAVSVWKTYQAEVAQLIAMDLHR